MRKLILSLIYPFAVLIDSKLRKSRVPMRVFVEENMGSFQKLRYALLSFSIIPVFSFLVLTVAFPSVIQIGAFTLKETGSNIGKALDEVQDGSEQKELTRTQIPIIETKASTVKETEEAESTPVDETLKEQDKRLGDMKQRFKSIGENTISKEKPKDN